MFLFIIFLKNVIWLILFRMSFLFSINNPVNCLFLMSKIISYISDYYFLKDSIFRLFFCLSLVFILNILTVYVGIEIPVAMLYAPILVKVHNEFCGNKSYGKRALYWYIPFFIMMIIFFLKSVNIKPDFFLFSDYRLIYISTLSILIISNSIHILFQSGKWILPTNDSKAFILSFLLIGNIVIGALLLVYIENLIDKVSSYNRILYVFVPFVLFNAFFIFSFIHNHFKLLKQNDCKGNDENQKYVVTKNDYFSDSEVKTIMAKIDYAMNDCNLFLQYNISLEKLAKHIGISRSDLSLFLNKYINKSFYEYIAEQRINYVLSRIDDFQDLSNEEIVNRLGYNSVSTFNKHFKDFTGFSLKEYKNKILVA